MNEFDWACDARGAIIVTPSGEIENVEPAKALLQAFLHEAAP